MIGITCAGAGGAEVLRAETLPEPPRSEGDLLIEVAAAGVNRADLLQRRGLYPPPPGASRLLGLEVSGRVLEPAGGFAEGDRVMALLGGGGYATRARVDPRHALRVPEALDLVEAGGVVEVFLTAFLNLSLLAELAAGERVLIHGGSGGVGTAALQWAKHVGAEVWTTCSAAKAERCAALGADRVLDYAEDDFAAELGEVGGADVILDCMGARYLASNQAALALDGRLVVIGLQGGVRAELDLLRLLSRRQSIVGSTLRSLCAERKAELIAAFEAQVTPGLAEGALHPVVDSVLPLEQARAAHERLESGVVVGKVILQASSLT